MAVRMMESQYLAMRITRSSSEGLPASAAWVRLEQIVPAATKKLPSLSDVYRAWNLAASGISARTERPVGCPVEFDGPLVRFFLGFYAWPSAPDLAYQLTTTIGEVGPAQIVLLPREFSAFVNNASAIDLPYYMEELTATWETPVYNRYGETIPQPVIVNHHTHLTFSSECFGALRISGKAVGSYHILTVEIDKNTWTDESVEPPPQIQGDVTYVNPLPFNNQNADSISGITATITATWLAGENIAATDQLPLEIPQCVLDVLAWCPGNPNYILNWCEEKTETVVYYSACTGDVVKVCTGLNPRKYCTQLALADDPGGWLHKATS